MRWHRALHDALGRLWVAHVWECDALAQPRFARALSGDAADGPFGISRGMWLLAPRFTAPALVALANPQGLHRWGYLTGGRPTRHARVAAGVLGPVGAEVDQRWTDRFGAPVVERARTALRELNKQLDVPLWAMPVLRYSDGLRTDARAVAAAPALVPLGQRDISELMAGPLVAMTVAYEAQTEFSLPLVSVVLCSLGEPCAIRDLPVRTGTSKEAVASLVRFSARHGLIDVSDGSVRRTLRGDGVVDRHPDRLARSAKGWTRARAVLDALTPLLDSDRLRDGLAVDDTYWRARGAYARRTAAVLADPARALPPHPLVLHRGGYPDGS